jgi:hypothetical protein
MTMWHQEDDTYKILSRDRWPHVKLVGGNRNWCLNDTNFTNTGK